MSEIREDLDGLRLRMPGSDSVWLVDKGKIRHIGSRESYDALFSTWDNIHSDLDVNDIESGESIPATAILFRCYDSPKVFLLDGVAPKQVKRHIVSRAVMSRFQFNWQRVHVWHVPLSAIKYPDGDPITKTGRPS